MNIKSCSVCGVSEHLKKCSICNYTSYCTRKCQLKDWKEGNHKNVCKIHCWINDPSKQIFFEDLKYSTVAILRLDNINKFLNEPVLNETSYLLEYFKDYDEYLTSEIDIIIKFGPEIMTHLPELTKSIIDNKKSRNRVIMIYTIEFSYVIHIIKSLDLNFKEPFNEINGNMDSLKFRICTACNLVSTSSSKSCGSCGSYYCDKKCQSRDWIYHKTICNESKKIGILRNKFQDYIKMNNKLSIVDQDSLIKVIYFNNSNNNFNLYTTKYLTNINQINDFINDLNEKITSDIDIIFIKIMVRMINEGNYLIIYFLDNPFSLVMTAKMIKIFC